MKEAYQNLESIELPMIHVYGNDVKQDKKINNNDLSIMKHKRTTIWAIGLLFMALYQYWVYTTFWIVTDDVTKVERAVHVSGDTVDIKCLDRVKGGGYVEHEIYILLDNRPEFDFFNPTGQNFFQDCNDFYSSLNEHLSIYSSELENGSFIRDNEESRKYLGKFEGYFIGSIPLKVTVNGYELYSFKDTKVFINIFASWLSLTPIVAILCMLLVRWYRNGGIEKLGQQW